jgi:hypothetical protein
MLTVPADPYLADDRSYVATTEVVDAQALVGLEGPNGATITSGRIDRPDHSGWVPLGSADPANQAGRFISFPRDRLTDHPAQLCLLDLPPDVACLPLPTR